MALASIKAAFRSLCDTGLSHILGFCWLLLSSKCTRPSLELPGQKLAGHTRTLGVSPQGLGAHTAVILLVSFHFDLDFFKSSFEGRFFSA